MFKGKRFSFSSYTLEAALGLGNIKTYSTNTAASQQEKGINKL